MIDECAKIKEQRDRFRAALEGLVGASDKDELRQMRALLRAMAVPDQDIASMLNALDALLSDA